METPLLTADPAVSPEFAHQPGSRKLPPSSALSSRQGFKWLIVALVLFLLQTLPFFSYRWVTDESWYTGPGYTISHWQGVSDPGMGPNDLEHTFDSRPPGTAVVMAGFFKLFGVSQVTARLGSLAAGLGIVLLTFFLLRDLFGYQAAALGALIAATDNLIVLTSRTARPEALTTVSILLSMLALKQYARLGKLTWALACGLLMAMGTMFHITLVGFIVSFGLLMIALDFRHRRFPLRGALIYTLGFVTGLVPYAVWILTVPNRVGIVSFKEEFINRAENATLMTKFLREGHRYSDLLGLGMLHSHGLAFVPVRLPIPLVFLLASFILWKFRRAWFYIELALLIPELLWLVYTANKSSRYLALVAPLFAMVIAAAAASLRSRPRASRAMTVAAILVVVAQFSANLLELNAARKANYNKVGEDLRSAIPPGATVYGTITFWLALRDRHFIAYERTSPEMAAQDFHASYFILGDPTMTHGGGPDQGYFKDIHRTLLQLVSQATLVAEYDDPYYGDLRIYKLQP